MIRGRRCVFRKAEPSPLKRTVMPCAAIWQVLSALCFCKILMWVRREVEWSSMDSWEWQWVYFSFSVHIGLVEACARSSLQYKKKSHLRLYYQSNGNFSLIPYLGVQLVALSLWHFEFDLFICLCWTRSINSCPSFLPKRLLKFLISSKGHDFKMSRYHTNRTVTVSHWVA